MQRRRLGNVGYGKEFEGLDAIGRWKMMVLVSWRTESIIIIIFMYCILLNSFCILGSFSISAINSAAGKYTHVGFEGEISSTFSITSLRH